MNEIKSIMLEDLNKAMSDFENGIDDAYNFAYDMIINPYANCDYFDIEAEKMYDACEGLLFDIEKLKSQIENVKKELKTTINNKDY